MPEWAMQLLVAGGGLGMVGAANKAWFNAWREDRQKRADRIAAAEKRIEEDRQAELTRLRAEKKDEEERVEKLQAKVESLLMDARAKAEEDHAERAERLAMDSKRLELDSAMLAALKEAVALRTQPKKDGA